MGWGWQEVAFGTWFDARGPSFPSPATIGQVSSPDLAGPSDQGLVPASGVALPAGLWLWLGPLAWLLPLRGSSCAAAGSQQWACCLWADPRF